ncbi:MAG: hypothetical protein B0W54_13060 [Cellvibrio sp. 79]|nr:MAG: hypothetical protein B0W54_13060 [Cellvibrio sp. 79]
MSYTYQNNAQQKSIGILVVIVFHLVVGAALISGLVPHIPINIPKILTTKVIDEKPVETPPPAIPEPVIDQSVIEITQPTQVIFDQTATPITTIRVDNTPVVAVNTVTKPKILQASKPAYPTASIRLGEEGATGLRLYINEKGKVMEVQLASSSGSDRLDNAAIAHAKRNWKFSPCMQGDKAVACWHQTKLVWQLENAR